MQAAYRRSAGMRSGEAVFHAHFPASVAARIVEPIQSPLPRSEYGARRRPSWTALGIVAALHVGGFAALAKLDVISMAKPKASPLVVELLMVPPAPPPVAAPSEQEVAPPEPVAPPIVVPKAVVITPAPPPPVVVTREPSPPKVAIVAPVAPAAPIGPMAVDDLSANIISAPPPRYPVESRRRKEQGTVFLSVLVGLDGSVAEIGVARSSGSSRLDKAALEAVRRWRWSPMMRAGAAVMVRGIVDIPFVLQG